MRPPVPEQISHAHRLTGTQYPGREVDSHHSAWFVLSLTLLLRMFPSIRARLFGLQLCPRSDALLLLRVVFGRERGLYMGLL